MDINQVAPRKVSNPVDDSVPVQAISPPRAILNAHFDISAWSHRNSTWSRWAKRSQAARSTTAHNKSGSSLEIGKRFTICEADEGQGCSEVSIPVHFFAKINHGVQEEFGITLK